MVSRIPILDLVLNMGGYHYPGSDPGYEGHFPDDVERIQAHSTVYTAHPEKSCKLRLFSNRSELKGVYILRINYHKLKVMRKN